MNRIAYTAFIAFIAAIVTLFAVQALMGDSQPAGDDTRVITLEEMATHDSVDSCWKAIGGRVYDITSYIPNHPTPESVIADWCGQESTEAWEDIRGGSGHSSTAAAMLRNYQIGVLEGAELAEVPEPADAETQQQRSSAPRPVAELPAGQFIDGSYYAEGEPDGRGWIALAEVTVKNGRIVSVHYDEVQRDEDGQVTNRKLGNYGYARNWRNVAGVSQLSAFPGYAQQLIERGTPAQVDGISGATSTYDNFLAVVGDALAEAVAESPAPARTMAQTDFADGSYYAELGPDGRGWTPVVEITVKGGTILSVHYNEIQRDEDGNVTNDKLSDYGYARNWRNVSGISQLSAFPALGRLLMEAGEPDDIDGLTGATSSYNNFREVANRALEDAR